MTTMGSEHNKLSKCLTVAEVEQMDAQLDKLESMAANGVDMLSFSDELNALERKLTVSIKAHPRRLSVVLLASTN